MTRRKSAPEQENTVEEEKMSPLVQETLDDLRSVPEPDPDRWEAARQAYLAEIQNFEAAPVTSEMDHNRGAGLRAFLLPLWERRPASMLVKLLILASVVLGGTFGTVEAAQSSLPGSALYPVKLQIEDLRAGRVGDPEDQVEQALEAAENRLEEAERLAERGDAIPAELGARYAEQVSLALQATDTLTGSVRSEVQAEIAEELADHLEELQELQLGLGQDDATLSSMRAAIEEAGAQLGGLDVSVEDDDDDIDDEEEDGDLDDIEDDLDDEEDGEDLDDEEDDSDPDDQDNDGDLDEEDDDASEGVEDDLDDDAYEGGEDEGDADDSDSDDDDGDDSSDVGGTGSDDEEDDSGSNDDASDDDSSDDGDDQSGGDDSDDGSNDDTDDGSDDDDSDDEFDDADDSDDDDEDD